MFLCLGLSSESAILQSVTDPIFDFAVQVLMPPATLLALAVLWTELHRHVFFIRGIASSPLRPGNSCSIV
jgi:hypothetical protein